MLRGLEPIVPGLDEAHAAFLAHADGLRDRIQLRSFHGMERRTVADPFTLPFRYLYHGRRLGLPQSWGTQYVVWLTASVTALWPMPGAVTAELRRRALMLEGAGNLAEQYATIIAPTSRAAVVAEIAALEAEIAADVELLAQRRRELESMK